jgi:Core-2/I-Branching enzyme
MKIAFLILAHTYQPYLVHLIRYCRSDGDEAFVHADARSQIDRDALRREGARVITKARSLATLWGSFAIVEATLRLMKAAAEEGFDRYVLISGLDLPIKTKQQLKDRLAEDEVFMCVWSSASRREKGNWRWTWQAVYKRHHYQCPLLNPRFDPFGQWMLDKSWRQFVKLLDAAVKIVPVSAAQDTHERYFRGSQWWALSHGAVRCLLAAASRNWSTFVRRFAVMHAPDEVFFQTLLMDTRYSSQIAKVRAYRDALYALHDLRGLWDRKRRGGWLLPADIPRLSASPGLFTRKVHPIKSKAVLEALFGGVGLPEDPRGPTGSKRGDFNGRGKVTPGA